MYKIWFTSFKYFATTTFSSKERAIAHMRAICFEATLYKDSEIVGFFSPINGYEDYSVTNRDLQTI